MKLLCGVFLFFILSVQTMANNCYQQPVHRDLVQISESPKVLIIENFLTPLECDYIIKEARPHLKRSMVVDNSGKSFEVLDNTRTSEGMWFPQLPKDHILRDLEERIAAITQFPRENGEALQVLHYGVGAEYRPHHDYFDPATPGGKQCCDRGGQRVATFMIYLHTTEEGGETIFPRAHLSIKPVKGTAVLFYDCLPDGRVDPQTLHGGAPVIAGEKWIITKWIRPGKFR
jgi:prolyl 4-hydroxylase